MTQTPLSASDLITLLVEQRELYVELDGLASAQHDLITGGEPERLL